MLIALTDYTCEVRSNAKRVISNQDKTARPGLPASVKIH